MVIVQDLCDFLEAFAPLALAAEWDNVGLLVGDRAQKVERVMTCLTVTPDVAREAVSGRVDLLVAHHPLPFKPLKRLTADEPAGRILLDLVRAGVAIYSPHTAFDSAVGGINQQLAEGLGLVDIRPLEVAADMDPSVGAGRFGKLPGNQSLGQVAGQVKQFLKTSNVAVVGDLQMALSRVAVACGSAGEVLDLAIRSRCQVLVTGETRLHTCYEAAARGTGLLLCGHYASERFGVERLAGIIAGKFSGLTVWASREERDPVAWV